MWPGEPLNFRVVCSQMTMTTKANLDENAGSSKRRKVLDRIPLGDDELVVSLDDRDRIDMRPWTATGSVRMASANGLTLHRNDLSKLLDALHALSGEEVS